MTTEEVKELRAGLYKIFWKDADDHPYSLAAVGVLYDGSKWLAPCNWTSKSAAGIASSSHWDAIEMVELIQKL